MAVENQEQFEAWLSDQSQEVCAAIALRAALRVLPTAYILERGNAAQVERALAVFRTSLASAVAAVGPEPDSAVARAARLVRNVVDATDAVDNIAAAVTLSTEANNDPVRHIAIASQGIIRVETAVGAALLAADRHPNAAASAAREARALTYADTALPLSATGLLSERVLVPKGLTNALTELASKPGNISLLEQGGPWSFWSRWYGRAMAGDPLPWDLQREIALIPDAIWEQGPEAVAEEIEKIEAAYLAGTTQLAEEVTLDPETGTFSVTPHPLENAPLISALLARTEDALDDALHGQNGLREDMRAVRTLRRTHQRYGNDPQRIELDYTSVAISLRREIRETQELAETEDNLALLEAVEEGVLAIRAQHPEIAENRQRIAQQKLREMDRADLEVLESAEPVLLALSEGEMAEDFARDIPQLINDATTPLPTGAPPLPGVDESMRVFHRVSSMKVLLDRLTDKGASFFDSKENKTLRLGLQGLKVTAYLGLVVEIGLKLFGVL